MLKKFFGKSAMVKNTYVLVQGTVLAQLITILMQPVLRRMFTTEDFGIFALYSSAIGILAVAATGRYEMAIVLPKEEKQAAALFRLSVIISLFFNVVLLLLALLFGHHLVQVIVDSGKVDIQELTHPEFLMYAFYLVPAGVFVMALISTYNYLLTRQKAYKSLSYGRIVQTGTANASQFGMGLSGLGFMGLLYGQLIGLTLSVVYWAKTKLPTPALEKSDLRETLRVYRDFPYKSVPSGLVNMLALQLPNLLLFSFFGAGVLGLFDAITKVLNLPLQMIGRSISQVFYQKISDDLNNNRPVGKFVRKFSLQLFLLMLGPMAVIFFFGEPLFGWFFGEPYAVAGKLAGWFSIFFLVRFVYYAQSTLFSATRQIGIEFRQNLFFLVAQLAALLVGHYHYHDFEITFMLLALSGFLCYTIFVISLIRQADKTGK